MAETFCYVCDTCNTNLGAGGALIDAHLNSYPTHLIRELIYDDSRTVAQVTGLTKVEGGILYSFDETRNKWLSKHRIHIEYAIPTTNRKNVYMRLYETTPATTDMGFLVPYAATITKLIGSRSSSPQGTTMDVRVYGQSALATVSLATNVYVGIDEALNVDVAAGTILSGYVGGQGTGSSYPQLIVEIARRAAG